MIRTALGGEGFFDLQKEDGTETCAPPRSGLVQRNFSQQPRIRIDRT